MDLLEALLLLESKEDEQKFIDFAGEELANLFLKEKHRFKSPENDIYYWISKKNNKTPEDLKNFLDNYSSSAQTKKSQREEGAKLVFTGKDGDKIYFVTTYDAMKQIGKGTKWCIAGNYGGHEEEGEHWFNNYIKERNLDGGYYVLIDSKGNKYCFLVKKDKSIDSVWDAADEDLTETEESHEDEDEEWGEEYDDEYGDAVSLSYPFSQDVKKFFNIAVQESDIAFEAIKKGEIPGEYKHFGIMGDYDVYQPLDYIAAVALSFGTKWKFAGRDGDYHKKMLAITRDAMLYWNHTLNGCDVFCLLDPQKMTGRIAVIRYKNDFYVGKLFNGGDKVQRFQKSNFNLFNENGIDGYELMSSLPDGFLDKFQLVLNTETLAVSDKNEAGKYIIQDGVRSVDYGLVYWMGKNEITSIEVPDSVEYISEGAFKNCYKLKSINIPESVKQIGREAFAYCNNLTNVSLSNGLLTIGQGAFRDCKSLENITIPESVTDIGNSAFLYCEGLKTINLPSRLNHIRNYLFWGCSSLRSIKLPVGIKYIETGAFQGCASLSSIEIPDGIVEIEERTFSGCRNLSNITIPNSVETIGEEAFRWCTSLPRINIPEGVTRIEDYAFADCTSLKTAIIPTSVKPYSYTVFSGCENLESIPIPDGITSFNDDSIYRCSYARRVELPDSVTSIGDSAFSSFSNLTHIKIPDGVTRIGDRAFSWCTNLKSIQLPKHMEDIGEGAFQGCKSLESLTLPSGITEIKEWAFYDCSSLKSIKIPNGVTTIGENAFRDCSELESITIPKSVEKIDSCAFIHCSKLETVYFEGTKEQFDKIDVAKDWTNKSFLEAKVILKG